MIFRAPLWLPFVLFLTLLDGGLAKKKKDKKKKKETQETEAAVGYSGSGCNLNGPSPTNKNSKVRFFAFGDAPYDQEFERPFEGSEYECLANFLPKMAATKGVSFAAHVGDIKKGNPQGGDPYCTHDVFQSRYNLLSSAEPELDMVLVVGDNEWNECEGYDNASDNQVKELWREYFTTGTFSKVDGDGVKGGKKLSKDVRQPGYPENFFFEFKKPKIAVFGLTEPAGDTQYDSINAMWVEQMLAISSPDAIVIIGHADMPNTVRSVLPSDIPLLYVRGNSHPTNYCMDYLGNSPSNWLELTVEPFVASPMLVSIVEQEGNYFFHVDKTEYGCDS